MLKTIMILPDGTEISSGNKAVNAIQKPTITECVNSGEDLTIGSVCSNAFEASIFTPNGAFSIDTGVEITVEKEDEKGNRTRQGIFILEKPTRPSANMMKIIGYDRISKLDKDLASWLSELTGWPYSLSTFAQMVCSACGLDYQATDIPNGDFPVRKFSRQSVTGRQIMQWLGEICCSFCRANKDGDIEFAWYSATGVQVAPEGDNYYFQNGLIFEDYAVAPVDAVQIRLADSSDGVLFPSNDGAVNSYIITGNPILNSKISQELVSYLDAIKNRLATVSYTPCKVELPAVPNIHAGDILTITDKNGKQITAYVMAKTQTGQKDTLECTGSRTRNSSAAANHQSNKDAAASIEANAVSDAKSYANQIDEAIDLLELLKRLDPTQEALYTIDGKLAIKATAILTGVLDAALVTIKNLIADRVVSEDEYGTRMEIVGGLLKLLINGTQCFNLYASGSPIMRMCDVDPNFPLHNMELTAHHLKIGGTSAEPSFYVYAESDTPDGKQSHVKFDSLEPSGNGNCTWEYNSTIGKYILVKT